MLSMTVPIGGAIVLVGVVILALAALPRKNRRVRNGMVILAVSGVVIAGWGFLRILRDDNYDHEGLLKERKHLCESVATTIALHQDQFLRGEYRPAWAEHRAALSALESEVSATWRMCVREESQCASMNPAMAIEGSGDHLDVVRRCFEDGPRPLESARWLLEH
jgi:hypothetical protein